MKYIEISLHRSKIYLTEKEISTLLSKDIDIYKQGLKRGKAFTRNKKQREREQTKFNLDSKY